jgi:hypothetical protein
MQLASELLLLGNTVSANEALTKFRLWVFSIHLHSFLELYFQRQYGCATLGASTGSHKSCATDLPELSGFSSEYQESTLVVPVPQL